MLPEVNHLNGDKLCNTPDNLQWVSHATNVQHAYTTNLSSNQGKDHAFAVQVIDDTTGLKFDTIKATAEHYNINYNTLRNALNGQQTMSMSIELRKCNNQ
jgi:HNH endonuclease